MTRLSFGRIAPGANGKHTLGKLECSGRTTLTSMPISCYDLFIAGNQINGFYTVKGSSTQLVDIYCDFTKTTGATGTLIGSFLFVDDTIGPLFSSLFSLDLPSPQFEAFTCDYSSYLLFCVTTARHAVFPPPSSGASLNFSFY